ncbi:MAG: murein L,D-transpeptidase catalytic domain family protein [Lysobacteraceae bacterium]
MRPVLALASAALVLAAVAAPARADNAGGRPNSLLAQLQRLAPEADPQVLALALESAECASASGTIPAPRRLAVIDYSRPSTERRLWVFDLSVPRILYNEYVAHGRASGENLPTAFSNLDSSHQSSLGLFSTAEAYTGHNGVSMRMDGLEPGFNDHARDRAIVMHGAAYVDPGMAQRQGRLGRSYGCPAVRPAVAEGMIDALKDGQVVFAYYPDQQWLTQSKFFRCRAKYAAGHNTANTGADAAIASHGGSR